MAQFEPEDKPPRPNRFGRQPGEDPLEWGLDATERAADRIREFSFGRFRPRWLRNPRFIQRRIDRLPNQVKHRAQFVMGVAQTGFLVIAATLGVALLFQTLSNQTIVEPDSAKEVFEMVSDPQNVSYTLETVRKKTIDGDVLSHHTLSIIGVDPDKGILQAQVSGIGLATFRMFANRKIWIMKFEDDNNVVRLPGIPSKDALTPVYASDLVPVAGKLISNKSTVAGKRGWLLTWKPTPQLLLRMIDQKLLMLDTPDIQAIKQGKVRFDYGAATVVRSDRRLYQLDVRFRANGAITRVLVTYLSQNSDNV